MIRQFNKKILTLGVTLGVLAAPASGMAQEQINAVFVGPDGWAVTTSRGLAECTSFHSEAYGPAVEVVEDQSHRLRLVKFDARGTGALALNRTPNLRQNLTAIYAKPGGNGLDVSQIKLSALVQENGDATYLSAAYKREAANQGHFVLDAKGRLVGVVSRWADNGANARIAGAGYIAMLLNAHGSKARVETRASRVQDAIVEITCAPETITPETPAFTEETLEHFGAEAWAKAFTEVYQASWSAPNAESLAFVGKIYAARVDYFGKSFSNAAVQRDKRNFAKRWDYRSYALQPKSLEITCRATTCRVEGVNDFFTYSTPTGKTSSGVAQFSFDLDLEALAITRENSKVLSRTGANPNGMLRSWVRAQRVCRDTGAEAACDQAAYTARVMEAFDYCVTARKPKGRMKEISTCN